MGSGKKLIKTIINMKKVKKYRDSLGFTFCTDSLGGIGIKIFEFQFGDWWKLTEQEILKRDWKGYHFMNMYSLELIKFEELRDYMKAQDLELDEVFKNGGFMANPFILLREYPFEYNGFEIPEETIYDPELKFSFETISQRVKKQL